MNNLVERIREVMEDYLVKNPPKFNSPYFHSDDWPESYQYHYPSLSTIQIYAQRGRDMKLTFRQCSDKKTYDVHYSMGIIRVGQIVLIGGEHFFCTLTGCQNSYSLSLEHLDNIQTKIHELDKEYKQKEEEKNRPRVGDIVQVLGSAKGFEGCIGNVTEVVPPINQLQIRVEFNSPTPSLGCSTKVSHYFYPLQLLVIKRKEG